MRRELIALGAIVMVTATACTTPATTSSSAGPSPSATTASPAASSAAPSASASAAVSSARPSSPPPSSAASSAPAAPSSAASSAASSASAVPQAATQEKTFFIQQDGKINPELTVEPITDWKVTCTQTSEWAESPLVMNCGNQAGIRAHACVVDPADKNFVVCAFTSKDARRIPLAKPVPASLPTPQPAKGYWSLDLADGSRCDPHLSGAWGPGPQELGWAYGCQGGKPYGILGQLDKSAPQWTVKVADKLDNSAPVYTQTVTTAWRVSAS